MTKMDEQGRPEPPVDADETSTLVGFLEFHRATFRWKLSGLDAAGLDTTAAASPMTLGGMIKHLAYVEDHWFSVFLHGREPSSPWNAVDWKADRDWDWHSAASDTPDQLWSLWEETVERSRAGVREALADGGPDRPARRSWSTGETPNLRWILCHMIEEYARHNGHADLIRESIDGQTGE